MSAVRVDRRVLRDGFGRDEILDLLEVGLAAVEPAELVRRALERDAVALRVARERVVMVSIGKAAVAMARGAIEALGGSPRRGVVVAPGGDAPKSSAAADAVSMREVAGLEFYVGGHPLPDSGSVGAAAAVERLAAESTEDDLVLCLLSGGGSSLVGAPVEGLSLADLRTTMGLLLSGGVPIDEANIVRRHLTRLSGGRLARLVRGRLETYALSDVPGSRPEAIASGPTVPDPATFADARNVLERRGLRPNVPAAVWRAVERGCEGEVGETLKPGDAAFAGARFRVIGCGETFLDAAALRAAERGWTVVCRQEPLEGEAREVGASVGRTLRRLGEECRAPTIWLAAGETTVTVRGRGMGGRNQEAGLSAAIELSGVAGASVAFLATDGVDGPTNAAGAFVDGDTARRIRAAGLDERAALQENDSHRALRASRDLLVTGPTGTNVADVVVGFVAPRSSALGDRPATAESAEIVEVREIARGAALILACLQGGFLGRIGGRRVRRWSARLSARFAFSAAGMPPRG
ncbi:MAG: DUF4147 domain-containing protein [Candidatus Bipolaricaulis sp.]|nr:DUF4147 domain-containing protein [Candidatus Bipolaricaulis sp.]